jgi:serine/threonine protein phosphatase PrpC
MDQMTIDTAALSTRGRRANNEDSFCLEPALGLFAVADGMGGYEGGEVASRIAVTTLRDFYAREATDGESTWPFGLDRGLSLAENRLAVAIRLAHREVVAQKSGALAMMGSTVAALAIDGNEAVVAHMGDSRIYRLRAGATAVEALTRDHSLWAELEAARAPDLPPREQFSMGHVITRALGMDGSPSPDVRRIALAPGDTLLLCTDGVTEKLDDARLAALLGGSDAEAICRAIVGEAYERGGRDNITALVVRCGRLPPSTAP